MDSQAKAKVRRVRCPRCWKVLEEQPDVSLYRCGGCGNILLAKNRNVENNCAETSTTKNQEVNVLEAKEAVDSVHVSTGPPSAVSSPDTVGSLEVARSNVEEKESLNQVYLKGLVSEGLTCETDESAEWTGESSSGIPSSGEFAKSFEHVEQQERDNFTDAVRDSPNLEDLATSSPSVDPLANGENGQVPSSYSKQDSVKGAVCDRLNSSLDIASPENDHAPPFPIVTSLEEDRNLAVCDSAITSQRSLAESITTCYLTCPEDEQSLRGSARIIEKPSKQSGITAERDLKQRLITNHPMDAGYYMHGRIMSSPVGTSVKKEPDRNHHPRLLHQPVNRSSQWEHGKYPQTTGYSSEINTKWDKNLLPPRPRFSSSSKAPHSELDKVELLRTVHELKDQLNRIQFPKVPTNRRLPGRALNGKFNSFNYDHLSGCTRQYSTSRMRFSGENFARPCPQERRYSSHQLHLTRPHFPSTELSQSRYETKPDEASKKVRPQERHRVGMRHVRPTAGAAPFLACYHCSKLLHLPADFLIFEKRRCHRLMCSACKKVLKFAIVQGIHIVPYIPKGSSPPPPSEADHENSRILEICRSLSTQGEAMKKNGGSMATIGSSSRIPRWRKSTSDVREDHRLHHLMGYSSPSQVYD